VGSEMREFHDLLMHFSCISGFTGRKENTSATSSSGRNTDDSDTLEVPCRHDFDGGRRIMLKL